MANSRYDCQTIKKSRSTIAEHINNTDRELEENSTCRKFRRVARMERNITPIFII